MLNDEIDQVRIGALHGIARFNQETLQLNEYEVDTVLFNLNEDNLALRCHIYALFGSTCIPSENETLLLTLVDRLIGNLYKRAESREDHAMIFAVLKKIGSRPQHASGIVANYHAVLGLDKGYLNREPQQNDVGYVARMILVYQAAMTVASAGQQRVMDILEDAPFFLQKHLNYLKDKYSQYFTVENRDEMQSPAP